MICDGRRAHRVTTVAARGHAASLFFNFFIIVKIGRPPDEEPVVMVRLVTFDPNPTAGRTGGDATFQPAVKGVCTVVLAFQKYVHNAKKINYTHTCVSFQLEAAWRSS